MIGYNWRREDERGGEDKLVLFNSSKWLFSWRDGARSGLILAASFFWFLAELRVPMVHCMGPATMRRGLHPCSCLVLCPLWAEQDAENADLEDDELSCMYVRNVCLLENTL